VRTTVIIGEVMMGAPRNRHQVRTLLARLPQMQVATDAEVLEFIERNRLYGIGIGYIDAHLLASVRLDPDATIWTRDRRMAQSAEAGNIRNGRTKDSIAVAPMPVAESGRRPAGNGHEN
jgi:predicted nucleic acid-binding protein